MPTKKTAQRACLAAAAVALAAALTACASEALPEFSPPTMAPDQNIAEACLISGDEVDRLTLQVEQEVRASLETAWQDVSAGKLPDFTFVSELSTSIGTALAEVEQHVNNEEVRTSLAEVRAAVQGFADIEAPRSLLGTPGYLAALTAQLSELQTAGSTLQQLCIVTPADASSSSDSAADSSEADGAQ